MSVNIVDRNTGNITKVAGNPIEQASGISYDHTSSGMQASNVQAAVDELKSGLTNKTQVVDATVSPDNNGYVNLSILGINATDYQYAFAMVKEGGISPVYRLEVWRSVSYGWIATVYNNETFTRVTDTTVTLNIVAIGIKSAVSQ